MHEYDVAIKRILTRPGSVLLNALTGAHSLRWLNGELPLVNNRRVDLLGESPDGELTHIELQAWNETDFPLRIAEYLFGIGRRYGRLPRQVVLYVGEARLSMPDRIEGPDYFVRFHMVDIRDLDGEQLLASDNRGDHVMAILTRLGTRPDTLRRILKGIADGPAAERDQSLAELLIIAGLRKLDEEVKREAWKMPILNDIMDHGVIGPLLRQGLTQGRAEGRVQGLVDGRIQGELALLRRQIEKKFGVSSLRFRKRLEALKPAEIEAAGLRLLDAESIEDLFKR